MSLQFILTETKPVIPRNYTKKHKKAKSKFYESSQFQPKISIHHPKMKKIQQELEEDERDRRKDFRLYGEPRESFAEREKEKLMDKPLVFSIEKEELEVDEKEREKFKNKVAMPRFKKVLSRGTGFHSLDLEEKPFRKFQEYSQSPYISESHIQQTMHGHSDNPRLWVRGALGATLDRGYYEVPTIEIEAKKRNSELYDVLDVDNVEKEQQVSKLQSKFTINKDINLKTRPHTTIPAIDPHIELIKESKKHSGEVQTFYETDSDSEFGDYQKRHSINDPTVKFTLNEEFSRDIVGSRETDFKYMPQKSLEVQFSDLQLDEDLESVVADIFAHPDRKEMLSLHHRQTIEHDVQSRYKQQIDTEKRAIQKEFVDLAMELEKISNDPEYVRP